MQWNDVYVSGCAAWLGRREDVRDAVADGRYDAKECEEDGYLSVCVADGQSPPDMAVAAGRLAVERSGIAGGDFDLVLHASVNYQGIDYWTPTPYIQARTVGGRAAPLEVQQACNGGLAGLEIAAAYLSAKPAPAAALVTTADTFHGPAFDRYGSDKGTLRGDGATAVVLSRGGGVARLLSTVMFADTEHEEISRGREPFSDVSGALGYPWDLRARRTSYLEADGIGRRMVRLLADRLGEVLDRALADAGVTGDDITRFVFTNLGQVFGYYWDFQKNYGIDLSRTTWDWGRTTGHVGAGDQAAGLTHLLETGQVRPGDRVALVGVGAGFSFGCAVLEVLSQPAWTRSTD